MELMTEELELASAAIDALLKDGSSGDMATEDLSIIMRFTALEVEWCKDEPAASFSLMHSKVAASSRDQRRGAFTEQFTERSSSKKSR